MQAGTSHVTLAVGGENLVLSSWARIASIMVGEPMVVVAHNLAILPQYIVLDRSQAFGMGLDHFAREVAGVPRDQKQVSAFLQLGGTPSFVHEAHALE